MEITDEDSKLLMNHFPYYTMVGMPFDADCYCFRQDFYCFPSLNFILKCKQMMPIESNKEKDYTINEIESTQLDYDNAKDFLENVLKIALKREAIDQQIQLLQKPKNIIAIDELSHKPKSIIDIIDNEQFQKESKKSSYDDILAPIELLVIFFFIAIIYFTII